MTQKDVETAVIARMRAVPALANLIGGPGGPIRIYATRLPAGVLYPACATFKVHGAPVPAMGVDTGVVDKRIQVTTFGKSKDITREVGAQVLAALARFRGTSDTIVLQDVFVLNDGTDAADPDTGVHQLVQEFRVWVGP